MTEKREKSVFFEQQPLEYDDMTPEDRDYMERFNAHQEALRTGGGDTRVTPIHPTRADEPLIVWPLEQATVPVAVHQPGATIVIENANPVAPPSGTATGVNPNQTSEDTRGSLNAALEADEVPTVDVAAETPQTAEEVADQPNPTNPTEEPV